MSESQVRIDLTESIKLNFETVKQLTVLNAGSIVVIGTFLSNIFPTGRQGALAVPIFIKVLLAASFVGFGASLLLSVFAMAAFQFRLETHLRGDRGNLTNILPSETIALGVRVPLYFFAGALFCFGFAVVLNMFR